MRQWPSALCVWNLIIRRRHAIGERDVGVSGAGILNCGIRTGDAASVLAMRHREIRGGGHLDHANRPSSNRIADSQRKL